MDISKYVSDLFYDHDCVIIPGFGGFICNYRSARIDTGTHSIFPPSKAISFNRNLQFNDGLLTDYIARKRNIPFTSAAESIGAWVNVSQSLLAQNEELLLKNIGVLVNDIQGNLQFVPDESVNYLKSSFGLRRIEATPIIRAKEFHLEQEHDNSKGSNKGTLRIAASVLLIAGIAALAELMWMGVGVKGLNLNQASVAGFVDRLFKTEEHRLKPIPVEMEKPVTVSVDTVETAPVISEPNTPVGSMREERPPSNLNAVKPVVDKSLSAYYIVVGAFRDDGNAEKVKEKLTQKFGDSAVLFEKHNHLTKVGYFAGSDIGEARRQLANAHLEDATYWLMKK